MEHMKKPYAKFPLTPHPQGYWIKVINGKRHRFGERWCTHEEAYNAWLSTKDEILNGKVRSVHAVELSLRDGLFLFAESREKRVEAGEIKQRTLDEYLEESKHIRDTLGPGIALKDIKAYHFTKLMRSYKGSPSTIAGRVTKTKVIFKWLHASGHMPEPSYGPDFKKPSAKTLRIAKSQKPKQLFTPQEVLKSIESARPQMKAMIVLGLFAGMGNTDCAEIRVKHFHGEWVEFPRPKTGIHRKAWLPPFALELINKVKPSEPEALVFTTKYGNPWLGSGRSNPIAAEFKKIRAGKLGFYALRHTCETIGNRAKDPIAVCHIMGHILPGMMAVYNEGVADDQLKAVGQVIEAWLLGAEATSA